MYFPMRYRHYSVLLAAIGLAMSWFTGCASLSANKGAKSATANTSHEDTGQRSHMDLAPNVALASAYQEIPADNPLPGSAGAQHSLPEPIHAPVPESLANDAESLQWIETAAEYLIQPGDRLAIKFRVAPELNEEVDVRPDGMIALQMIGDVLAAYRAPEELRAILVEAYRPFLRNPDLVVIVRQFAGNRVFVGGEVQTPGGFLLTGKTTTLQAIIQAGGFRDTADRHRVIVRRFGGGWEVYDLHGELSGKAFGQDLPLQPQDVVYVPKSRIAEVNQFVDQYINRVIPFQRSFGYFLSSAGFNQAAALGP